MRAGDFDDEGLPDRLVEDLCARVRDLVERDFVARDFVARDFVARDVPELALVEDFLERDR